MAAPSPCAALQTTLCSSIRLAGRGLHTGVHAEVVVAPGEPDDGIVIEVGGATVQAVAANVVGVRRCTSLGHAQGRVDTVEHLLAALRGLGVDNARISVDGPEIPILDGSARPWVDAILGAGLCTQPAEAWVGVLDRPVCVADGGSWLVAAPADAFSVTCVTQFDHPLLGTQVGAFADDAEVFAREVAPARTFGFAHEVEALRAAGLAQGGTLANALVVYPGRFSDALRVPDECLRHKVLDLWGDLALAGVRLRAAVTAIKPGHRANVALATELAAQIRRERG